MVWPFHQNLCYGSHIELIFQYALHDLFYNWNLWNWWKYVKSEENLLSMLCKDICKYKIVLHRISFQAYFLPMLCLSIWFFHRSLMKVPDLYSVVSVVVPWAKSSLKLGLLVGALMWMEVEEEQRVIAWSSSRSPVIGVIAKGVFQGVFTHGLEVLQLTRERMHGRRNFQFCLIVGNGKRLYVDEDSIGFPPHRSALSCTTTLQFGAGLHF